MDAFFVSVELRRRPDLAGQPVVVGGTGRRGVVAAASYEARRFGVHSAMPSVVAMRRCPHAVFLPGDHALYSEVSAQVREILDRYTPLVEPLSLDEAFLDVTGSIGLFGPAPAIAARIRADVDRELALACSVGVAANKFLAKLASVEAKPVATPGGVHEGPGVVVVEAGHEQEFLRPLRRATPVGCRTRHARQAASHRSSQGRRPGRGRRGSACHRPRAVAGPPSPRVWRVGSTTDPSSPNARRSRSVTRKRSQNDKHELSELRRELVRLSDAVAQRLRRADVGARTLTLKLRFDTGFQTITRSVTCPEPTDLAPEIVAILTPVLESIDPSPGVRLLGVSGSNLGPVIRQLTLDDAAVPVPDWAAATEALDEIRQRFGASSIGPASALEDGRLRIVRSGEQQWGPSGSPLQDRDRK